MGISWSHCDPLCPMRQCSCSIIDTGWLVPFFPFSKYVFPPSSTCLFFLRRQKWTQAHYLISILLVHLLINLFLTPRELYTFFGLFQLEDLIGVALYLSLPFCIFAVYTQCSRLTEYLLIWCALPKLLFPTSVRQQRLSHYCACR